MAGTLKTNAIQLGDSATASQNFVWQTNVDGTAKLARGNVGATTQDILTIDANGRVSMPQTVVAFSAWQSTLQSVAATSYAKVQFQTKEFDTTSAFDAVTNFRFQPLVAGYYQLECSVNFTSAVPVAIATFYKNGAEFKRGMQGGTAAASLSSAVVAALVYLNGSTDYMEVFCYQGSAGSMNTQALAFTTYFQGILLAKA